MDPSGKSLISKALKNDKRIMLHVPRAIERHLQLKAGGAVMWVPTKNGAVVLVNAREITADLDKRIQQEGERHEQAASV